MTRIALTALYVLLSAPAWGQTSNSCIVGDAHCLPSFWGGNPADGNTLSLQGPFAQPSNITFGHPPHEVTLDLDKGTVDLHGAKVDAAAKAFWDAVQDVIGRHAVTPRAYTLDDIDRMRAAVRSMVYRHYVAIGSDVYPQNMQGITYSAGKTADWDAQVENELRTYMAAGISPEELKAKASHQP